MKIEQAIQTIASAARAYYKFNWEPVNVPASISPLLNPVEKWRVSTAFGGWWGYCKWADGSVENRFRGYPSRPNPAYQAARLAHLECDKKQTVARDAYRVGLGAFSGEAFKLFANESEEHLLHRYHSNNSRKDRAVREAVAHVLLPDLEFYVYDAAYNPLGSVEAKSTDHAVVKASHTTYPQARHAAPPGSLPDGITADEWNSNMAAAYK